MCSTVSEVVTLHVTYISISKCGRKPPQLEIYIVDKLASECVRKGFKQQSSEIFSQKVQ